MSTHNFFFYKASENFNLNCQNTILRCFICFVNNINLVNFLAILQKLCFRERKISFDTILCTDLLDIWPHRGVCPRGPSVHDEMERQKFESQLWNFRGQYVKLGNYIMPKKKTTNNAGCFFGLTTAHTATQQRRKLWVEDFEMLPQRFEEKTEKLDMKTAFWPKKEFDKQI